MAQGEQFDFLGPFGAKGQEEQPNRLTDSEVDEGPQLTTWPGAFASGRR